MESFTHWDYAEVFSGRDAAYLIGGFDPSAHEIETDYKIRPILTRMKKSYYMSVHTLVEEISSGAGFAVGDNHEVFANVNPLKQRKSGGDDLWSVEIEGLVGSYNRKYSEAQIPSDFEFSYSDKLKFSVEEIRLRVDARTESYFTPEYERLKEQERVVLRDALDWAYEYIHEFDDQRFSRSELRRWIVENNLASKYPFEENVTPPPIVEKPLSTTERNSLLTIIAALCDYSDIKHQGRGVAVQIAKMTAEIGAPVTDDTVRDVLAKIPGALDARTK